ncbi:hypothetical protein KW786_02395 [Candidatus Parcubacteria bacterium]|nr:hypothetical protein [Candidatus Parcubacteria bacterium]
MNALQRGTDELARLLFRRMKDAGLFLRPDLSEDSLHLPVPEGWTLGGEFPLVQPHHRCEEHRVVHLPLVLVVDMQLPEIINDPDCGNLQMWMSSVPFEPYWLSGVTLIHDHMPLPDVTHRTLSLVEAACLFAQNSYVGSVQCFPGFRSWGHGRSQVYWSPEAKCVVASHEGIPGQYSHHAAFVEGIFPAGGGPLFPRRVAEARFQPPAAV